MKISNHFKNLFQFARLLLCLFLVLGKLPVQAQKSLNSFKVEISGKGNPMILIPGLTCSGEVWAETVSHYQKNYQCHVLTLAGFAGQPAIQTDKFLETVRQDLANYIRHHKLNKPVVVGHSLGGFVAMWLGAKEPDLVGPLVIVDSAPFLPSLINPAITMEQARYMAEETRKNLQNQTIEQLRQIQPQTLRMMITDENKIAKAAEWSYASDKNTVGKAMAELYTTDLRQDLSTIKVPTLVMAAWVAYKPYGATHESTKLNYDNQFKQLANYELVVNDKARHFIMWDDPTGFFAAMDSFLSRNQE